MFLPVEVDLLRSCWKGGRSHGKHHLVLDHRNFVFLYNEVVCVAHIGFNCKEEC